MSKTLTYKGFAGQAEIDWEAKIIFGRVQCGNDVVTFKGKTVEEAIQAFHDSVDDHLEFCQRLQALDELAAQAQELGMGYESLSDEIGSDDDWQYADIAKCVQKKYRKI